MGGELRAQQLILEVLQGGAEPGACGNAGREGRIKAHEHVDTAVRCVHHDVVRRDHAIGLQQSVGQRAAELIGERGHLLFGDRAVVSRQVPRQLLEAGTEGVPQPYIPPEIGYRLRGQASGHPADRPGGLALPQIRGTVQILARWRDPARRSGSRRQPASPHEWAGTWRPQGQPDRGSCRTRARWFAWCPARARSQGSRRRGRHRRRPQVPRRAGCVSPGAVRRRSRRPWRSQARPRYRRLPGGRR